MKKYYIRYSIATTINENDPITTDVILQDSDNHISASVYPSPVINGNSNLKFICNNCHKYTELYDDLIVFHPGTPSVYITYCSEKCLVSEKL